MVRKGVVFYAHLSKFSHTRVPIKSSFDAVTVCGGCFGEVFEAAGYFD